MWCDKCKSRRQRITCGRAKTVTGSCVNNTQSSKMKRFALKANIFENITTTTETEISLRESNL